jgi:uncharacterized protein involved in response to NO
MPPASNPSSPAPHPVPDPVHAPRFALLALGFRPLYLVAALFAALAIPAWIAVWTGRIGAPEGVPAMAWHAHEMIFGFVAAVVIGFLFTAGRNWTNRPTPVGAGLAALVALWLAGRAAMATGPHALAAAIDLAFLPACAVALARALVRAGNRRNYLFVGLLGLLTAANAAFHLAVAGAIAVAPHRAVEAALLVVVMIVTVMAGRVVPMFTRNGTGRLRARAHPAIERIVATTTVAAATVWLLDVPAFVLVPITLAAAAAHVARIALWDPLGTRRHPLLWILHVSYAWIPIGFALMAAAALTERVTPTLAVHAFALGAVGGMIVGMITRTARGHTGRPLIASAPEAVAFACVHLAAAVRVFGPIVAPDAYLEAVVLSGALWSAAFALYAVVYWPILTRPRLDGRPG